MFVVVVRSWGEISTITVRVQHGDLALLVIPLSVVHTHVGYTTCVGALSCIIHAFHTECKRLFGDYSTYLGVSRRPRLHIAS
jgi:hypothetical protein